MAGGDEGGVGPGVGGGVRGAGVGGAGVGGGGVGLPPIVETTPGEGQQRTWAWPGHRPDRVLMPHLSFWVSMQLL